MLDTSRPFAEEQRPGSSPRVKLKKSPSQACAACAGRYLESKLQISMSCVNMTQGAHMGAARRQRICKVADQGPVWKGSALQAGCCWMLCVRFLGVLCPVCMCEEASLNWRTGEQTISEPILNLRPSASHSCILGSSSPKAPADALPESRNTSTGSTVHRAKHIGLKLLSIHRNEHFTNSREGLTGAFTGNIGGCLGDSDSVPRHCRRKPARCKGTGWHLGWNFSQHGASLQFSEEAASWN